MTVKELIVAVQNLFWTLIAALPFATLLFNDTM
jgi:hypothetical protein